MLTSLKSPTKGKIPAHKNKRGIGHGPIFKSKIRFCLSKLWCTTPALGRPLHRLRRVELIR
jgi:hypothetical protein